LGLRKVFSGRKGVVDEHAEMGKSKGTQLGRKLKANVKTKNYPAVTILSMEGRSHRGGGTRGIERGKKREHGNQL